MTLEGQLACGSQTGRHSTEAGRESLVCKASKQFIYVALSDQFRLETKCCTLDMAKKPVHEIKFKINK